MEESAILICNIANKLKKENAWGKKAFYKKLTTPKIETNIEESTVDITTQVEETHQEETIQVGGDSEEEEIEKPNEPSDKDYVSVIKKIKKENITPDNIDEIMLCQIPGISSVTALAIIDKFKSITNLLKQTEQNIDCLKDIIYTNNKGQIRKISKSCSTNIVKFLLKK